MTARRLLPDELDDHTLSKQKIHVQTLLVKCRLQLPHDAAIETALQDANALDALPDLLFCRRISTLLAPYANSHTTARVTYYVTTNYYERARERYLDDLKLNIFCVGMSALSLRALNVRFSLDTLMLGLSVLCFMNSARLLDKAIDWEINRRRALPRDAHFQEALAAEYHTLQEWGASSSTALMQWFMPSAAPEQKADLTRQRPPAIQTNNLDDPDSIYDRSPTPVHLSEDEENEDALSDEKEEPNTTTMKKS